MLPRLLSLGEQHLGEQHLSEYRKFAREWSRRARTRGRDMEEVIEKVAAAILSAATFLQFP
jgi:hypothetical protein